MGCGRSTDPHRRARAFFAARLISSRSSGVPDADTRLRDVILLLIADGWSRSQMAQAAGMDLSSLCGWLDGRRHLGPRQHRRLGRWARPVLGKALAS